MIEIEYAKIFGDTLRIRGAIQEYTHYALFKITIIA